MIYDVVLDDFHFSLFLIQLAAALLGAVFAVYCQSVAVRAFEGFEEVEASSSIWKRERSKKRLVANL